MLEEFLTSLCVHPKGLICDRIGHLLPLGGLLEQAGRDKGAHEAGYIFWVRVGGWVEIKEMGKPKSGTSGRDGAWLGPLASAACRAASWLRHDGSEAAVPGEGMEWANIGYVMDHASKY